MTNPISRDGFEAWLADPVTQFVMAGLTRMEQHAQADWLTRSWNTGTADQDLLNRLKAKAQTWHDIAHLKLEDAYGANGLILEDEA